MLKGVDPLLGGELLGHLDRMGHSDAIVIADANFPAHRLGPAVVELRHADAPRALAAVLTLLPIDAQLPALLMDDGGPELLPVQSELAELVINETNTQVIGRQAFYDAAGGAQLIVRTGELRPFANIIVRKGVVGMENDHE